MNQRIEQIKSHYLNGDESMAFRMLMDCVIDTSDVQIFKKALALNIFRENKSSNKDELIDKSVHILDELKEFPYVLKEEESMLLSATGIHKRYSSFHLEDVSIEINTGDVWGLVGENGNGENHFA